MKKIVLKVDGMSCAHCEKAIVNELTDIGALNVKASAQDKAVEVAFDPIVLSQKRIVDELNDMGYTVIENV